MIYTNNPYALDVITTARQIILDAADVIRAVQMSDANYLLRDEQKISKLAQQLHDEVADTLRAAGNVR